MAECEVCGAHVEERGFQVLVAGHAHAYDRVECAERGRMLAAAGGAAFRHPFNARTIVVDAPRAAAAAVASAGIAGSLLARASLARAKLAFGGAWLLATSLAAASLYLLNRSDATESSAGRESAGAPAEVESPAPSVPFVHQADLPPVRISPPPPRRSRDKVAPQPVLVRDDAGAQPAAPSGPPAPPPPQPAPTAQPEPPPPAIQPVEPPSPPVAPPAAPTIPTAAPSQPGDDDDDDSKPGWGHGDDNHEHTGPNGKGKKKH